MEAQESCSKHGISGTGPISLAYSASQVRSNVLDKSDLFSKVKAQHSVELIQLESSLAHKPKSTFFEDAAQLTAHFQHSKPDAPHCNYPVEIYSIHQEDSWSPLNLSRDMITTLLDHCIQGSGFLHILACFRDRYLPIEESFSGAPQMTCSPGRSEFGWVYRYSEKKAVRSGNPWRIRQTGIYHTYDKIRGKFVYIVISPNPTAHFLSNLREALRQNEARSALLANPLLIHAMLISSHLFSWREYLEYQESLLLKREMQSVGTVLDAPLVSFDTLKEVRAIEKNMLLVEQITTSFNINMHGLDSAFRDCKSTTEDDKKSQLVLQKAIEQFKADSISYKDQARHILKRVQSTAQSVSDILNLNYQQLAQSQSQNTFIMATSAREDSIAIRAITLVTSFYLPFSFVATMFGMNLMEFDTKSRNLSVSHQVWLYFVISVPLTALTLVCWRWRMQVYRQGYGAEDAMAKSKSKSVNSDSDIEMV